MTSSSTGNSLAFTMWTCLETRTTSLPCPRQLKNKQYLLWHPMGCSAWQACLRVWLLYLQRMMSILWSQPQSVCHSPMRELPRKAVFRDRYWFLLTQISLNVLVRMEEIQTYWVLSTLYSDSRNHDFLHAFFILLHFSVYKVSEVTSQDMYLALPNLSHSLRSNQCNDKIISEGVLNS